MLREFQSEPTPMSAAVASCSRTVLKGLMMPKFIIFSVFILFCQHSLADSLRFKCVYPTYSGEDFHGKESYVPFELEFTLDTITQKAFLVGNNGMAEVTYLENDKGWNFLEITGTGNIIVTTITQQMNSVHSRNVILSSLIATQYYGSCSL